MNKLMKCGHRANSTGKPARWTGESMPACVICSCFEVAEPQPSLEKRRARCTYYGHKCGLRGSCDYPRAVRTPDDICRCEADSNVVALPFFEYKPNEEFDAFYCGCSCGWD